MKNIRVFLSENFQFLEVKFSIYLNRHVFVMLTTTAADNILLFLYVSDKIKTTFHLNCLPGR